MTGPLTIPDTHAVEAAREALHALQAERAAMPDRLQEARAAFLHLRDAGWRQIPSAAVRDEYRAQQDAAERHLVALEARAAAMPTLVEEARRQLQLAEYAAAREGAPAPVATPAPVSEPALLALLAQHLRDAARVAEQLAQHAPPRPEA